MKFVLPLVVLAVIVAGFAYYTLFAGPRIEVPPPVSQAPVETMPADDQPAARESFTGAGTLYSLLTRGDSLECAITYIPNPLEPEVMGSMFTNEGQVRGDFVVPTPDLSGQMVTSIIISEGTVWQWTDIDGELVGSQRQADFTSASLARLVAPVGFDTEVQYSCLSWSQIDNTIFEAPSTVLFTSAATAEFEEGVIYKDQEPEF